MAKKINPNRIPVTMSEANLDAMIARVSNESSYHAWLLLLAAYSNLHSTSCDSIVELWKNTYTEQSEFKGFGDVQTRLNEMENETGVHIELDRIDPDGIGTEGDLLRFQKRLSKNSLWAALCVILETVDRNAMLQEEEVNSIWKRIAATVEEINDGQLSFKDIEDMLEDEYQVKLLNTEEGVKMALLEEI